jgi:hypothetical protein
LRSLVQRRSYSASQKKNFTFDGVRMRHSSVAPAMVVQPVKKARYAVLTEYQPSGDQRHMKRSGSDSRS